MNIFGTFTRKESTGRLINASRDHTRQQSGWLQNSFFSERKNPSQHSAKTAAQSRRAYRSHSPQSKNAFIDIYECISAIYQGCRTCSKPLVTNKNVRSQKNLLRNKTHVDKPARHWRRKIIGTKRIEAVWRRVGEIWRWMDWAVSRILQDPTLAS